MEVDIDSVYLRYLLSLFRGLCVDCCFDILLGYDLYWLSFCLNALGVRFYDGFVLMCLRQMIVVGSYMVMMMVMMSARPCAGGVLGGCRV